MQKNWEWIVHLTEKISDGHYFFYYGIETLTIYINDLVSILNSFVGQIFIVLN